MGNRVGRSASLADLTYPSFLLDATRDLSRVPTGASVTPSSSRFHTFSTEMTAPGDATEFRRLAHRLLTGEVHRAAGAPLVEYRNPSPSRIMLGDIVTITFWGLRAPCLVLEAGVETLKDSGAQRVRLVYGTLPSHMECGEEAFELTYRNGVLTARVVAFSRAAKWYTRCGGPVARFVQRVMARRYAEALIGKR